MVSLQGKRALVTGGSRGVGAAVSKILADRGAKVAINYSSNKERAEQTRDGLAGSGHVIIPGDAFSHEGVNKIAADSIKALGGLDIVVSNVGWTQFANFDDIDAVSDEDWNKCFTTNVMAHLWLMQAVKEELKKNNGAFVISASVAGLRPGGSSMAYSVTKAGSVQLTRSLAKACAPEVRVNAVAAGVMETEWSQGFSPAKFEQAKKKAALNKISAVEDVAKTYVDLIENGSMTGQIIEVSCGLGLA